MHFSLVGISFKTTTIDIREKLAFDKDQIVEFTNELKTKHNIENVLILSTCNRTEIYYSANDPQVCGLHIWKLLLKQRALNLDQAPFYAKTDLIAVEHLFRVISSLDSLVVGEAQIAGQVKQAFKLALKIQKLDPLFWRSFDFGMRVAKKIRSSTSIGESITSVGHIAVDMAKNIFGDLSKKSVLVLGAGDTAKITLSHLKSSGVDKISIINRTFRKSAKLADIFKASVLPFEDLNRALESTDILIASVSSSKALIGKELLSKVMRARRYRSLFLLDLGLPRNISAEVSELDNVYLFNIDDLEKVAADNFKHKQAQSLLGVDILKRELEDYVDWVNLFEKRKTLTQFRANFKKLYFEELSASIKNLGLEPKAQAKLNQVLYQTVQKILHPLTNYLKENIENQDLLIADFFKVFKLDVFEKKKISGSTDPHCETNKVIDFASKQTVKNRN